MNNKINMINLFRIGLFLIVFILPFDYAAYSQQWTEPVRLSVLGNEITNNFPDIYIDTNEVLHCVYENYYYDYDTFRIMYIRSFDKGITWEDRQVAALSYIAKLGSPHVVANDTSLVHLTYDNENGIDVLYRKYNGGIWHEASNITQELPGLNYRNMPILDYEGRLYVFWDNSGWNNYYRYMENDSWSTIFCPYCDSTATFYLNNNYAVDSNNNLHFIGAKIWDPNPMYTQITYFKYNKEYDNWYYPEYLTNHNVYNSQTNKDIALNSTMFPHFIWRDLYKDSEYNSTYYSVYKQFENEEWSIDDTLAATTESSYSHQIEVDGQDDIHILMVEKTPNDHYQLTHYIKKDGQWIGYIIEESDCSIGRLKLIYKNNTLYLIYGKSMTPEPIYYYHVYFRRYDIVTGKNEINTIKGPECKVFPNPFVSNINIQLTTLQNGSIWIYVLDMQGRQVREITRTIQGAGEHHFNWDGTNNLKQRVPAGNYLIRIVTGKEQIVKMVQLLN